MANIINGTDTGSGGLITTGDSSDELQLQTAETARVTLTNTAVVVNEDGNDVDFRVEGDTDANLLFVDAGNDRVGVKTSSPAVAFDVVGQVRASTGILFGTDTAAANALDDYEEGTFTPTIVLGITSITYIAQSGFYTKIGRLVSFSARITLSAGTAAAAMIEIGSLPFTSLSTGGYFGGATIVYAGGPIVNSTSTNLPTLYIPLNTTKIQMYKTDGNVFNGTDLSNAGLFDMYIVGSYFT